MNECRGRILKREIYYSCPLSIRPHITVLSYFLIERPLWCLPLVPKFAGSYPAEAVGFFRAKKSSARLPSEGK